MPRQTQTRSLSQTDLTFVQHRGLTPAEFDALAVPGKVFSLRCRVCVRIARALLVASRWFEARSGQAPSAS